MTEETIFAEALEKSTPIDRTAYLDKACAGDTVLRKRIETLLKSHEADGDFLGKPAIQCAAEELAGQACAGDTRGELPAGDGGVEALEFLAPSDKPDSLGRLGHYEILEVIGHGGMGIVLRAIDEKLQRVVAIKVMAAQLATNATARKRFNREAQAAAAVTHDHIVTIHAVEDANGLPYLVMQYVSGMSLQERLDRSGPLEVREIVRIGMQTAAGLAAAHAHGLIHRDIKPANILLENGVERVKITDFGLARAVADASLTQSGVVAGTPQYMSPEQARGEAVDQRTDLFSLGSVLYAMCTGRPPFRAESGMAVLKRVCDDIPSAIRETNPEIPDWLVAIVTKLHAKNPADRFQSAPEVAELLKDHLAHLQHPSVVGPVAGNVASPSGNGPGVEGAAGQPAPRRRRWAMAAAALLLSFVVGLGFTEATGVTSLRATVIRIFTPQGTLVVEDDKVKPDGSPKAADKGGEAVAPRAILKGHNSWVHSLAFSPDGKTLATGSNDQRVRLWDTATGNLTGQFHADDGMITSLAYSPDGTVLVSASNQSKVRVWDAATFKLLAEAKHDASVGKVAFRRGDAMLATASDDKTVKLWKWDGAVLVPVRTLGEHSSGVSRMSFNPQGTVIASATRDGMLYLWDVESGKPLKSVRLGSQMLLCLAFSPDGRTLAAGGLDKKVELRKADTLEFLGTLRGHKEWVYSLVFLPDGKTLVSAGAHSDMETRNSKRPGELKLWDTARLKERLSVDGYETGIRCVALSADGKTLATGDISNLGRLWDVDALLAAARAGQTADAGAADVLKDAVLLMNFEKDTFYQKDGKTYVRDLSGRGNDGLCNNVAFTPDGKAGGGLLCQGGQLQLAKSLIDHQPNYTITAWCRCEKPGPAHANQYLYLTTRPERLNNNERCFNVHFPPERTCHVNAWNADLPEKWIGVNAGGSTVPAGWFFVAIALTDGETGKGKLRIVIDDRIHAGTSQMVATVDQPPPVDVVGYNMNGVIDELAVFQRALSDEEIQAIRQRGIGGDLLAKTPQPAGAMFQDALLWMTFEKDTFYTKGDATYVRDLSGHGRDGLCEGCEFTPAGQAGGALRLKGGALKVPHRLLNKHSEYTVAAWIFFNDLPGSGFSLIQEYPKPKMPNFTLSFHHDHVFTNAWNSDRSPAPWKTSRADLGVHPGQWNFVAVRLKNGGLDKGELLVTRNDKTVIIPSQMQNGLSTGFAEFGRLVEGMLDELLVLPRALSDDEVRLLYQLGKEGRSPELLSPKKEPAFRPLFNGTDLMGWSSAGGGPANWNIVNGAITCSGPEDYLYTDRDNFGDFHLRAEVKINADGNSGVYFRTGKPLVPIGDYEAQITNHPDQPHKTGSLYGLTIVNETLVPPPETWFTLEIIAVGKRIRVLINGKETADYTENRAGRNTMGHIALQHLGPETRVFFRKIEIKELPAAKFAADAGAAKPVLLMHFDEADFYEKDGKTYVRDRSGNGNDGLCEQVQFTPQGKSGGGLANAGKGFLRLKSSLITGKSNFTIAGWAKFADLKKPWALYVVADANYRVGDPRTALPSRFHVWRQPETYLFAGVWNGALEKPWINMTSGTLKVLPGEWLFIAAALEEGGPGKGRVRLMLNDRIWERPFQQIGGSLDGMQDIAALNLEGVLDELAVWDRALTEQELRELFALGKPDLKK